MNPYLRNLLILTLIGTVNFFAFMFISGRSSLLFSKSPIATKSAIASDTEASQRTRIDIEDLFRHGAHGYQPPSAKQPAVIKDTEEPGRSFIFRSPTNISRVLPKDDYLSFRTSFNTTHVVRQIPVDSSGQNTVPSPGNLLALYNRDDSARVNPHDYRLILDEPQACFDASGAPKEVFLLVLICTIHKNFEQRRAIRETWGSPRETGGKRVITMFLLAYNEDARLQRQVEEECSEHHDLLQEDFQDTYKNLTLKTIMAMKWASTHCPQASYVMKTDDDMFVSYDNLVKHLASTKAPSVNHAEGFLINGGPIRDPKSKWYMPKDIYPGVKYPPFLSGTGYVMSGDVASKIYEESLDHKYLHLEDVFVAICLDALKIKPVKNKDFHNWRTAYSYCRFRRLMTTHMVQPSEMHRIWSDQHRHHNIRC
ncbi:beta-1,3-galactosyltransferase 1-like [Patiria miniata]|uniref:Hexosyltransferase n=1 Tax=Patiria miniata TaxID=46514 RepID=A0A914A8G3_PATMI|nr:beta-1,3-galactosyltransferase 1-like [Patiria miniata]XP_038060152.1 beta-1,3-galactosyltransferase 1-like [Patiria miniata]